VVFRLRRTLRIMLLAQGASGDEVARLLSMHHRTLNRRLKAEGTTFQQLLDEVRFEAACQLLDTARMPITEIAVSLSYAETSAFSRAFRRWSGGDAGRKAAEIPEGAAPSIAPPLPRETRTLKKRVGRSPEYRLAHRPSASSVEWHPQAAVRSVSRWLCLSKT
jgi:hypothetical protein